jgi:hypothetical protein
MDLVFGILSAVDTVDTQFENIVVALFQKFIDFFVLVAGNKTQFVAAIINGYGIGIEFIAGFTYEFQFGSEL